MNKLKKVSRVYDSSPVFEYDDNSRIVIMSDVHRGDGSWADDFSRNQNIYFAALSYYYMQNFLYIENGDGDELWKFRSISEIIDIHSDVYWILSKFYKAKRLILIYGNHDIIKKNKEFVKKNLYQYYYRREKRYKNLFKGIEIFEGVILEHTKNGNRIFLTHGHQVDLISCELWRIARFLVRYIWMPLETFGVNDPTNTAKNYQKKRKVEIYLSEWVEKEKHILISGHTHRPMLPEVDETAYINIGSCVHPRCITAIEIVNGEIILVKWANKTRLDGTLYIGREVLAGPKKIEDYYLNINT